MTLYGYARDPSAPEPEASPAYVPQPRSAADDGLAPTDDPADLWGDPAVGTASTGTAVGTASVSSGGAPFGTGPLGTNRTPDYLSPDYAIQDLPVRDYLDPGYYSSDLLDPGHRVSDGPVPDYRDSDPRALDLSVPVHAARESGSPDVAGPDQTASAAPDLPGSGHTPLDQPWSDRSAADDPVPAYPVSPASNPAPATVTGRVSVPGLVGRPPAPGTPTTPGAPAQAGPPPISAIPAIGAADPTEAAKSAEAAKPVESAAPSDSADAVRAAVLAWSNQDLADLDGPEIQPWDRRPLFVVLAAAAVLVLVAVVSGVASANLFRPGPAAWQVPRGPDGAKPTPGAAVGAVVPPAVPDTITLSGVGDVIMGTQYPGGGGKIPPQNGVGFFDPVKTALAADLVMGNLETPLTVDTGAGKCAAGDTECFQFFLPPAYANYLRDGGFQIMNLANNHTNDMGSAGLANTRAALESAGVGHTGAPNEITMVDVKGVKVAVLGFSVYSWGANLNNIPASVALVKTAAAQADLVVIQMQGGAEGSDKTHVKPGHEYFVGEDRGDLVAFSHAVIDAGADVVFGHGPHIMRGMEFYKGRLISYSLGNFCGYGVLNSAGFLGVGGVLKVTLHRDGTWASGNLVPTQMVRGGMVEPDPNQRALAFVDGLSTTDFGPTAARISAADGSIFPPSAG